MQSENIKKAAKILINSKNTIASTGAGISVESGIPPFRGKGGIWEKFNPMEYAHIDAFMDNPEKVWKVLLCEMKNVIDNAKPNNAHIGLAELEKLNLLKTIITQNVDGLHQLAGNLDVIEFHGTFALNRCIKCNKKCNTCDLDMSNIPPKCDCGGIYRPDCVFFGEMIPPQNLIRSQQLSNECETMVVIGTSATVEPSASMPFIAKENGATIIEINKEPTCLTNNITDIFLQGRAGVIVNDIVKEIKNNLMEA